MLEDVVGPLVVTSCAHGVSLIWGSCLDPFTFQRAVKLASSGRLGLAPLVSHVLPLKEISQVFKILDKKIEKTVKAGYKSINKQLRKEIKITSIS